MANLPKQTRDIVQDLMECYRGVRRNGRVRITLSNLIRDQLVWALDADETYPISELSVESDALVLSFYLGPKIAGIVHTPNRVFRVHGRTGHYMEVNLEDRKVNHRQKDEAAYGGRRAVGE